MHSWALQSCIICVKVGGHLFHCCWGQWENKWTCSEGKGPQETVENMPWAFRCQKHASFSHLGNFMIISEGRWWDSCQLQDQDHLSIIYHFVIYASRVTWENGSLLVAHANLSIFNPPLVFWTTPFVWCYLLLFQESSWSSGRPRRPITRKRDRKEGTLSSLFEFRWERKLPHSQML